MTVVINMHGISFIFMTCLVMIMKVSVLCTPLQVKCYQIFLLCDIKDNFPLNSYHCNAPGHLLFFANLIIIFDDFHYCSKVIFD